MQATARPRFRQDLLAEVIEEGGQKYIDVADPDGNSLYRFFEVEYAIACGMDGQRDVAGIVKWAQDELGLNASTNEIQSVIDTLSGLAFIGDDQLVDQAAAKVATQTPAAQAQPPAAKASAPAAAAASSKPAAAKASDDLAAGIVVGKAAQSGAASKGLDIELGSSGASAPVAKAKEAPSADIALGAPGASQSKAPPKAPVEDFALGAPGATAAAVAKKPAAAADVSMDLSAEMSVGKGDVKEAVRQSKVMPAVEVPKELLEAETPPPAKVKTEAKKDEKKPEPKKEEPKKEAPASTATGSAKKDEKKPEPKKEEPKKEAPASTATGSAKKDEKKSEAKKDAKADAKKPVVQKAPEKQPVAPPAPSTGVSPALIVTLIVVIVAAGAFLAYKFVFAKEAQPVQPIPTVVKPAEPPPPTTATAKVVIESPPVMEVKAGAAGTLESFEPVGKEVKAGETIATLAGAKPLEAEIDALTKQIEQLKAPIATAEEALKVEQGKENNEAAATAAQKKLDALKKPVTDKETQLKAKQEALDKLAIKSTGDGKITAPATSGEALAAGSKVAADQVIATITRNDVPTAMFKIPAGTKIGAQGTLSLVVDGGDKTVVCQVTDAQSESVKVACPADAGLANGAGVTITLPSP